MLCGQALHLFAECLHNPAPASSHPSDTPSDMPRVAIIGTAGRKGPPLSLSLFHAMFDEAVSVITKTWGLSWHNVDLISGGAAWADHVAVVLYLCPPEPEVQPRSLVLHLPCAWDYSTGAHYDSGAKDWKRNPGRTANLYHKKFSRAIGRDTLQDISMAVHVGCQLEEHEGFHQRNSVIADVEYMLAFTWGATAPEDGGSLDTWKKCKAKNKMTFAFILIPLSSRILVVPFS